MPAAISVAIMIRKVTCRPVDSCDGGAWGCVPIGAWLGTIPAISWASPPNTSGAAAMNSERTNVRTLSARPHRPAGMMSSRAA